MYVDFETLLLDGEGWIDELSDFAQREYNGKNTVN